MRPVGYSGLEGRGGAFKMAIKQVNGHWYLFLGHLWNRGWSIVDVTQPEDPKYLKFVPGPDNTWTIQVDFHDNLLLTGLQDFYAATARIRFQPGTQPAPTEMDIQEGSTPSQRRISPASRD
jgi:hypothetical protein